MKTATAERLHTPFHTLIATDDPKKLAKAIWRHKAEGKLIGYDGMIGTIEGPDEGDLFAFVCPEANFEDFVPASSLCTVS